MGPISICIPGKRPSAWAITSTCWIKGFFISYKEGENHLLLKCDLQQYASGRWWCCVAQQVLALTHSPDTGEGKLRARACLSRCSTREDIQSSFSTNLCLTPKWKIPCSWVESLAMSWDLLPDALVSLWRWGAAGQHPWAGLKWVQGMLVITHPTVKGWGEVRWGQVALPFFVDGPLKSSTSWSRYRQSWSANKGLTFQNVHRAHGFLLHCSRCRSLCSTGIGITGWGWKNVSMHSSSEKKHICSCIHTVYTILLLCFCFFITP